MSPDPRDAYVPPQTPAAAAKRGRAVLYGYGHTSDGHVRLTRGPGLHLVGGTEGTHARMQERVARLMDEIARRGYRLDNLTRAEADEVARLVAEVES